MIQEATKGFHPIDYVIFSSVCVISLIIGLYHAFTGGHQKTTNEYFMANHNMKTVPVALSILVSFVSAILVLGTPAEMYTRGTQLTVRVLGYSVACVLSSVLFVPLFYSIKATSSFEFLERRFKSKGVKLMGSVMMLIGNIFYMGLVMYTPSTALEAVTGFPLWTTVLVIGVLSTIYTTLGGMKAVIWTDVFQCGIMISGMLAIVCAGTVHVGGLSKVWNLSQEGGRLIFLNLDPDPTQRLSTWSLVIGGMFSSLTIFGIGQSSVQRYCALPTLAQAKRSVLLNIPGLIIVNILASLVGLVVYAYYAEAGCDPLKQGYISNANQIVPYFVIDVLNYPGFPGIFLAVLFSGALSSMSSILNSAAAVTWEDFLKPYLSHIKEHNKALVTKVMVVLYGCLGMLVSFMSDGIGGHVLQASLSFSGATTGPSLGMFVLGAFFKSANAVGAVIGCLISLSFSLWLAIGTFITKPYKRSILHTTTKYCALPNQTSGISNHVNGVDNRYHQYDSNLTSNLSYPYGLSKSVLSNDSIEGREYVVINSEMQSNSSGVYSILSGISSTTLSMNDKYQPEEPFHLEGVNKLYGLSFLWYSAFGCIICVVVGLIVSAIVNKFCEENYCDYDEDLIVPVFELLCSCLPEKLQRKLCYKRKHVVEFHSCSDQNSSDNKNIQEKRFQKDSVGEESTMPLHKTETSNSVQETSPL